MDPNCPKEPPPRQKIPKDGFGPRGVPDCYYTSRVLDSTAHYVRFVKKLRALEDEQRIGAAALLTETRNQQFSDFFQRCDRRALINNVAHRVDLCLASYQEDLAEKRKRLIALLAAEEEENIRKFVVQVQEGPELIWQEKKDRLAYLLAKRKKEREEKYGAIPLEKCAHLHPCLIKSRAVEAQDFQLYQMREKQMRKETEKEFDKMWYELAMRESEALAARMEQDVIDRKRRDIESKEFTDYQCEMNRQRRIRDREKLKQESIMMKAMWNEAIRKADEEENERRERMLQLGRDKKQMIVERQETVAKQRADDKLIADTWDSLAGQSLAADLAAIQRKRQQEREVDECNFKLVDLKNNIAKVKWNSDPLILAEGQRRLDAADLKRCQYRQYTKKLRKEISDANQVRVAEQMREKEAMAKDNDKVEYTRQVAEQLDELVKHRELTDAQARKLHQKDILEQIEYNKVLKERAWKEELEQRKKCELAAKEYQDSIEEMFRRPYYSDHVHPFLRQMAKDLRRTKCPCTQPTYCADSLSINAPKKKEED